MVQRSGKRMWKFFHCLHNHLFTFAAAYEGGIRGREMELLGRIQSHCINLFPSHSKSPDDYNPAGDIDMYVHCPTVSTPVTPDPTSNGHHSFFVQ